jgi:single-strand DNA-binding protein
MNSVTITGRLAAQPEVKTTSNGKPVCSFRLAVSRPRVKDKTDWIPCTAWNQSAEFLGKYAAKGNRIGVSGVLTSREYEDKDGNKRTAYEVLTDSVEILESRSASSATTSSSEVSKTAETSSGSFSGMEGIEVLDEESLPF